MASFLEKILNLAKKTGDNVIVFNPAKPQDSYVILAMNSYEKLVDRSEDFDDLTVDDLDDKINPEIEPWDGAEDSRDSIDWYKDDEEAEDDFGDLKDGEEGEWHNGHNFLPDDIFDGKEETPERVVDDTEKAWEEDVNYLYPTEEEFAAMAKAQETPADSNFNSVADILQERRDQPNNWSEGETAEQRD